MHISADLKGSSPVSALDLDFLALRALLRCFGHGVVALGDLQHRALGIAIPEPVGCRARLVRTLTPVSGIF
jgi:hypothetical protein